MRDGGAVSLARLRASGTLARPDDPVELRALATAASRAGRVLIDVAGGRVALGWPSDAEAVWTDWDLELRHRAAPRLARTFAAVLRACWPDPAAPLYPGRPAAVAEVLYAAATLGTISGADDAAEASDRHAKGALVTLSAAGLVELDRAAGLVRLGPAVACWPDGDAETLRQAWSRLPAAPDGASR